MSRNADARAADPGAAVICDADEIAAEIATTAVSGQAVNLPSLAAAL